MADRVAKRSPARLCSRDGKLFYYRRVEYDFLAFFLPLLPSFLPLLPSFSPSLSRHVSLRVRPCSNQLVSNYYVFSCRLNYSVSCQDSLFFFRLLAFVCWRLMYARP